MENILARFLVWLFAEPLPAFLLTAAACGIFGTRWNATQPAISPSRAWGRRILQAGGGTLLFFGLVWFGHAALQDATTSYQILHNGPTLSDETTAQSLWGSFLYQPFPRIEAWENVDVIVDVPREDPLQAPAFHTYIDHQEVEQVGLTSVTGQVILHLGEKEAGGLVYRGYFVDADFSYFVKNNSPAEKEVYFEIPLPPGQSPIERLLVSMDGKDMIADHNETAHDLIWHAVLKPGQVSRVRLAYTTRGRIAYFVLIPAGWNLNNFLLSIMVDNLPVSQVAWTSSALTPTSIQPTLDGQGSVLTWNLDRSLSWKSPGIDVPDVVQKAALPLRVLQSAPAALSLFAALVALTMLLCEGRVRFLDLALYSVTYTLQYLLIELTSDLPLGFWIGLAAGALLTVFAVIRNLQAPQPGESLSLKLPLLPRLTAPRPGMRTFLGFLALCFAAGYPLSSLLAAQVQQNSFRQYLAVGIVVYLAGLTLYQGVGGKQATVSCGENHAADPG